MSKFKLGPILLIIYILYLELFLFGALNGWYINDFWTLNSVALVILGVAPAIIFWDKEL